MSNSTLPIHLIVQYYRAATPERQVEIDTCLRENLQNSHIAMVHLLTEELFDLSGFPNTEKINQTVVGERLTFERAFNYANNWPEPVIWMLSNADIYFEDTLRYLQDVDLTDQIFALTRHNVLPDGSLEFMPLDHAHGSQDAWIFTAPVLTDKMFTCFYVGIPGCDNKILFEFIQAGYLVANPSRVLIALHLDNILDKDTDSKTAEYVLQRTQENISKGKFAPGPYQYFLYPTDNLYLQKESSYSMYLDAIRMLTRLDELCTMQKEEMANLKLLNAELNCRLNQIMSMYEGILNSATWRLSAPIRKIIDKILLLVGGDKTPFGRVRRLFKRKFAIDLDSFLGSISAPIAIIPCAFEFDELVNQRPINFAKCLSSKGYYVVYAPWQWNEAHKISRAYEEVAPNILQVPLLDLIAQVDQIHFSPHYNNLCLVTIPSRNYVCKLPTFRAAGCTIVYDVMDDWAEFHKVGQAKWYEQDIEEYAVLYSDVVSAVSIPLQKKFDSLRSDVFVIGNGLTPALLGEANADSSLCKTLPDNKIVAGYFGHMTDAWIDWDAVISMCETNNNIEVHLIGYGLSSDSERRMQRCPNIILHGKVPTSQLHAYVKDWHVALIPFKPGKLSDAVDPIKIYEYLFFGLPSVVMGISSIANYPCVYYCPSPELLIEYVDRAYTDKINGTLDSEALRKFLQQSTWDKRLEQILHATEQKSFTRLLYA